LPYDPYWRLLGFGDYNGDGHQDVLYKDSVPGEYCVFFLNGVTRSGGYQYLTNPSSLDSVLPLTGANEGADTVISSVSYTLPTAVENLTLASGAGSINGTGNALDNVIIGNDGNNVLTGGAGNDILTGGLGSDTFVFAAGFGTNKITDFHVGEDILQFDHTIFATASAALSHAADNAQGSAVITVGADSVVVQDVSTATLQQHLNDFHIV